MNDQQTMNVLKGLVIDAVHKAQSGHPGGPLSSMDFAYLLYTEFLKYDPTDPGWLGRDRFILSAGHSSMLQYSLLHMQGILPLEEIKRFRQLHSKTPGHPENFITKGIECTTGPLGQGAAMSVGFALAGAHFRARLDEKLFNYKIWALLGDGCMQECVTLGAASLAGHLQLKNLVWFYDANQVQISGHINRAFSDDMKKIFEGFHWKVIECDGHNHDELRRAMTTARQESEAPLLIIGHTTMAKGVAEMEGDHETHGAPLPDAVRQKTKELLGLPKDQDFYTSEAAVAHFRRNYPKRAEEVKAWKEHLNKKMESDADFAKLFRHCFEKEDLSKLSQMNWPKDKPVATRNAFGDVLEKWATELPNLIGGSADLEPSNMTGPFMKKVGGDFTATTPKNRNIAFGVREFPMSAICNGMALHGGVIPFDATFLSFADYSRPALRLGAIQKVRVIHEFTHDSFYLGEDGPTHQPVEHLMALRVIPEFYVMRPADAVETEIMMRTALRLKHPTAICLTRQKLPLLSLDRKVVEQAEKGAYAVRDCEDPEYLILATGSEVSLALKVAEHLGQRVKVVSMPSWELFEEQSPTYRQSVLPPRCRKRISIEAGVTLGWQKYTLDNGLNIGLDRFGDSAPMKDLEEAYGFTAEAVLKRIQSHKF